jgi:methylenetetrahydrofolate dehydrogenase (NADP+)/methenyltetrahydrofolate cyclohydrolase
MDKVLYGKSVSLGITDQIKELLKDLNILPTMTIIKIGSDPASEYYFQNVIKQGTKLGLKINLVEYPLNLTKKELEQIINRLNNDYDVHGILLQKPLPDHINEHVDNLINPIKDIDGTHPLNMGKIFLSQESFVPCTAAAVMALITHYKIKTAGKHVVILGRSPVVAKPLAGLLLLKSEQGNATVTICHSFTPDIGKLTRQADIVVSAIGKPNFVVKDMLRKGAICLDVGINLVKDDLRGEHYVGDFDFESCLPKCEAISPVPGGIGTITTSILLLNLAKAASYIISKEKLLTY